MYVGCKRYNYLEHFATAVNHENSVRFSKRGPNAPTPARFTFVPGPLISRETVRFLTHRPAMPLAQFVDYFWFYDGLTPANSLERVLPESTFEILINLREEPR